MTREEALNDWLPIIRQMVKGTEVYTEALDMAIKALEQQPTDAVDRQAVLDCFKKWQPYMATRMFEFEKELKSLPSVTPQPKMGKWIYRKEEDSYRCSLCTFPCHKDNMGALPTRYCAECGAKMQEVKDES